MVRRLSFSETHISCGLHHTVSLSHKITVFLLEPLLLCPASPVGRINRSDCSMPRLGEPHRQAGGFLFRDRQANSGPQCSRQRPGSVGLVPVDRQQRAVVVAQRAQRPAARPGGEAHVAPHARAGQSSGWLQRRRLPWQQRWWGFPGWSCRRQQQRGRRRHRRAARVPGAVVLLGASSLPSDWRQAREAEVRQGRPRRLQPRAG